MSLALRIRRLPLLLSFVCMALLALAVVSSCTSLGVLASGHLDIEAADLQTRIARNFPSRHCKTVLFCVELANPQVALTENDDRVGLAVDLRIVLGTREHSGHVELAGRPRYLASQGQLFLDDLEITRLDMPGLSDETLAWVKIGATVVARQALQDHPVYTLDDSTAKGALAKRAISDVRVVGGKLRVTFS
jgi:hypothetical protein